MSDEVPEGFTRPGVYRAGERLRGNDWPTAEPPRLVSLARDDIHGGLVGLDQFGSLWERIYGTQGWRLVAMNPLSEQKSE